MKLLAILGLAFLSSVCADATGPQSQYKYTTTSTTTPLFDWNITIVDFISIDKPTTEQGIYNLRSTYLLDDRSYDIELFKVDCESAPSGIDNFPLVFKKAVETPIGTEISTEIEWTYNQTKIESSDLWTANKTGGYSEFCIRLSNYLPEGGDAFAREIHFLEIKYKIEVDSLTDFNTTIDVTRIDATDGGTEVINYEEDIEVFQCDDTYTEIASPPALTQGDYLQLCVKTVADSKFGVHSVKELDLSQQDSTPSLYPYVDGFIDSPLAESDCKMDVKNTTDAVCKTKMQLLSAYFDLDDPADLFANGTLKVDYVGRRLTVDVPVNLRVGDNALSAEGRALAEADEDGAPFGIEVSLSGGGESDAFALSMGGLFSAAVAFLAAGMV